MQRIAKRRLELNTKGAYQQLEEARSVERDGRGGGQQLEVSELGERWGKKMWPDMRGHIWREGGGRRERRGARANLVGQARGGQEPRRERGGKGDDDAILSGCV